MTQHYVAGPNGVTVAESALTSGAALLTAPSTNTASVWVDSSPLTSAMGVELTPGSSQPWPEAMPLHAWSSVSADLYVTDGLDAGTNPGAIASAILSQGLASQIASQIQTGGVPLIDAPTVLWDNTTNSSGHTSPSLDISKYQSVAVFIFENQTGGSVPAPPGIGGSTIRTVFVHLTAGGGSGPELRRISGTYAGGGGGADPQWRAVFPAVGDTLSITVNGTDTGIASLTSRIVVVGSHRTVSDTRVTTTSEQYNVGDPNLKAYADGGSYRWEVGTLAAGASVAAFPDVKSGPGKITFFVGSAIAAPGIRIYVQDLYSGAVVAALLASDTTPGFKVVDVVAPHGPLVLYATNNSATTAVNAVIYVSFQYDQG